MNPRIRIPLQALALATALSTSGLTSIFAQTPPAPTTQPAGNMNQMMSMMRNMMTMMSSNVEGRIDALKIELKITQSQVPQWDRFADALRMMAKTMSAMSNAMTQPMPATLPARLDRHEKMMEAHFNALKALKDTLDPLYAVLSADQKKVADTMMIGPMGMM
jgi:hypothetical protein